jgi:hypothetical protein
MVKGTVGAVCIANAKNIANECFAAVFTMLKKKLNSFLFNEFDIRNKKKKFETFFKGGNKILGFVFYRYFLRRQTIFVRL